MNISYLNNFFTDNSIDLNSIQLYYDFSEVSGVFLKNKIYDDQIQFNPVTSGFFINKKYSPAFFNTKYGEISFTGSGIFQGTNTMQIFEESIVSDNSLFINFANLNCNKNFTLNSNPISIPTGKIQTLSYIKSKNNTNPFEIILGLNDANKLTLEFSGGAESYKIINPKELSFQNICCLKFGTKSLQIDYYDIIENEINSSKIFVTGNYFNQYKNIYIGNIASGYTNNIHTGFFGAIDDILLINNYLDNDKSFNISKLFIKTGETLDIVQLTGLQFDLITSAYINPTGIIGEGIISYTNLKIEEALISGNLTGIYIQSGITGFLTGEKIEFTTSNQSTIVSTGQNITKYDLYDEKYASNFTKNNIIFNQKLDNEDVFEIQYYLDSQIKINYADYSINSDLYITTDDILNKNTSIYFNGLRLVSGENYNYIDKNKFTISNYNTGSQDSNDSIFYTSSSLTGYKTYQTYFDQSFAFGNYYLVYTFSDDRSNWGKSNIFLNGQKLISGFNYLISGFGSNKLYFKNDLPTGLVAIIKDDFISGVTGCNIKKYNTSLNYNNEQIWINGVYQHKGDDYILTSCYNNLLIPSGDIEVKRDNIFYDEYHRFNL
jgi:hypothetical protein